MISKTLSRFLSSSGVVLKFILNYSTSIFPVTISESKGFLLFVFKSGFTSCKVEHPLRGMELREKEVQKD